MNFLHKNLKVLRTLAGKSQDVFSIGIGTKRSTYSSWESGASEPSVDFIVTLAYTHHITADTLLNTDLTTMPRSEIEAMQLRYKLHGKY